MKYGMGSRWEGQSPEGKSERPFLSMVSIVERRLVSWSLEGLWVRAAMCWDDRVVMSEESWENVLMSVGSPEKSVEMSFVSLWQRSPGIMISWRSSGLARGVAYIGSRSNSCLQGLSSSSILQSLVSHS